MEEKMTESEICMLLDTYMYFNYTTPNEGATLKEVMENLPNDVDVKGRYSKEYAILKDAVSNPRVGELKVVCQSQNMGYNSGTNAITFYDEKSDKAYVVFRGTADGEWIDNGQGLSVKKTKQQEEAVSYFDEVVETMGFTESTFLATTGHSKGANKAQFITMDSKYGDYIDITYSIDGQGHSKEAIENWKSRYSKEEYERRVNKIYGINGQNDYVSVLGISIIPAGHIEYIKTPAELSDFAAYHDITRMYAKENEKGEGYIYDSKRNKRAVSRGELGNAVAMLSEEFMKMPEVFLDGSAITAMQIAEIGFGGRKTGIDGARVTSGDILDFRSAGFPLIVWNLLTRPEGIKELKKAIESNGFSQRATPLEDLDINYIGLLQNADKLDLYAGKLDALLHDVEETAFRLPFFINGITIRKADISYATVRLKVLQLRLKKLAALERKVAGLYAKYDAEVSSIF